MKKKQNSRQRENREMWMALAIFLLIVVVIVMIVLLNDGEEKPKDQPVRSLELSAEARTCPFEIDGFETVENGYHGTLNESLELLCIGRYSGKFVEDESNKKVQNVLALIVKNTTKETIGYAQIKMNTYGPDAFFDIYDLPAGDAALVLEASALEHTEGMEFKMPLCFDCTKLTGDLQTQCEISIRDQTVTVENRSDEVLSVLRYKTQLQEGLLLGGVAYQKDLQLQPCQSCELTDPRLAPRSKITYIGG